MSAAINTPVDDEVLDDDTVAGGQDTLDGGSQVNPLEMSDDEFLKQAAPTPKAAAVDTVAGSAGESAKPIAEPADGSGASKDPKAGEGEQPTKNAEKPAGEKPAEGENDDKAPKDTADKAGNLDVNAKAEAYDRLMAPFRANGREIQARSVEDAISLMQMGANYNKRMAGLKPVIRIAKMLENNGLLDEEKLSYLIDLHAKKPEAITKLVKDAGLNPMDLDLDKAGDYRASSHKVDDREVDLDTVLDDIKDSSAYTKTLSIARAWDADSKKILGDHPGLLQVINTHVERGIYDLITAEVERERTFGRLQGLSDIAAYRQVGDAIQARGGFDHLGKPDGDPKAKSGEAGKVVEPKPKKDDDESRNDKRRAMGSPRPAAPSGQPAKDFNPLALSDDEFLKQATPKFR